MHVKETRPNKNKRLIIHIFLQSFLDVQAHHGRRDETIDYSSKRLTLKRYKQTGGTDGQPYYLCDTEYSILYNSAIVVLLVLYSTVR